jgi:tetratricopeptide (TPR) repeat protein
VYREFVFIAGVILCSPLLWGQVKAPAPTTGRPVGSPTTTTPNNPNNNNLPNNSNNAPVLAPRPIFLSGKVVLQDGTPPPEPVRIERVCGANPRAQGYTDHKGHFSFQLDSAFGIDQDASEGGFRAPGMNSSSSAANSPLTSSRGSSNLAGCELRAQLAGFRSSSVNLGFRQTMDNPDVGTIVLTRMGNVEGTTISMTSLNAPKDSLKAFNKGRDLVKKEKYDDAQKEFQKAVDGYPQYASAWYQLGLLQASKQPEEAEKSFHSSIAADPKFMNPYLELVLMLEKGGQWQPALDLSTQALKLNGADFPQMYFFHAVAAFNLHDSVTAEKSAREALRLDTRHQYPKCEQLLGVILAQKQDYTGAAEHIRAYLEYMPNATDAAEYRKQLAALEKESVAAKQP